MKKFPKESINLILTDPPYNIADSSKLTKVRNKIVTNKEAWGNQFKDKWNSVDDYIKWISNYFIEMNRVLKDRGSLISFLDRKYTGLFVYILEKELNLTFKNKIYFEKLNPLPHFRKNNYRSTIEECIWMSKTAKSKLNFISQKEMKQIFRGNIGRKVTKHPTEKYDWMIVPLIKRHSDKNDIILDPFMGSGTVAEHCERLHRRWIGVELNSKYCEMIKLRINNIPNSLF